MEICSGTYNFWDFESDNSLSGFVLEYDVAPGYGTFILVSPYDEDKGDNVDWLLTPQNLKVFCLLEEANIEIGDFIELKYIGNGDDNPYSKDFELIIYDSVDVGGGAYSITKKISSTL